MTVSLHDSSLGRAVALTLVGNKVIAIVPCDSCRPSRRVGRLRWAGGVELDPASNGKHGTIEAQNVPFQVRDEEIPITAHLDRVPA